MSLYGKIMMIFYKKINFMLVFNKAIVVTNVADVLLVLYEPYNYGFI